MVVSVDTTGVFTLADLFAVISAAIAPGTGIIHAHDNESAMFGVLVTLITLAFIFLTAGAFWGACCRRAATPTPSRVEMTDV